MFLLLLKLEVYHPQLKANPIQPLINSFDFLWQINITNFVHIAFQNIYLNYTD